MSSGLIERGQRNAVTDAKGGKAEAIKRVIRAELDRVQFGTGRPKIVLAQLPIGYGGQISGRITALKLALSLNRKAVFETDDDPPYVQTLNRPYQSETGGPPDRSVLGNVELFAADDRDICMFDYVHATRALSAVGSTFESWMAGNLERKYGPAINWENLIDGWIFEWLSFLPSFEDRAECDRNRLGISNSTLGVHFRRGDKSVESAYVPAGIVNDAIRRIHRSWPFESLFLASDDPQAPESIQPPPSVRLIFDRSEARYNNANHKMLMATPSMAAEETYIAFKNLRLLAGCGGLVGQTNAHFATIAASFILQRDGRSERVTLIDGHIAERQSRLLGTAYRLKRKVRAAVKDILPAHLLKYIDRARHRQ
jgi:hypothetical protein